MTTPDLPLSDLEFVAFDLETTGLWPISCRIVELGAVRFRLDGTELGRFEQLVDPGCEIPESVIRVHGITNAMTRGMPTIREFRVDGPSGEGRDGVIGHAAAEGV